MSSEDHSTTSSLEKNWTFEDDRRKKHEAIWKQNCSRTHRLWCECGDWISHIKPKWSTTGDGVVGGGDHVTGGDTGGVDNREQGAER
nr:ORF2 [Torque teno felis virus]